MSDDRASQVPSALEAVDEIDRRRGARRLAVFLDYDGTLTPIVERPEDAVLSTRMRAALRELAGRCTVAVISGRDLPDVREKVGLEGIFYAGSHGFDIAGPPAAVGGRPLTAQKGTEFLGTLDRAEKALQDRLAAIAGARIERKKFSIAVHYREVAEERVPAVAAKVDQVLADRPRLRKSSGKKIFELQPDVDWDKGKAVLWLLHALGLDRVAVMPVYIGDDTTDEDAFAALAGFGVGIVVADPPRHTAARYALKDPGEVRRFLGELAALSDGRER